jgi:hypothetical protein
MESYMPAITVNLVGGDQKENTSAVTIGAARWGVNGTAFGQSAQVAQGNQTLTAYKSTNPTSVTTPIAIGANAATVSVTVNLGSVTATIA